MDAPSVKNPELLRAALAGLSTRPKGLSPKWLYDARGSELFEEITVQPEYYPTRTETALLRDACDRLAAMVPEGAALVELGSGASVKTRILLDRVAPVLSAYLPLDISEEFLRQTAEALGPDYPGLAVRPVVGDFTAPVTLPAEVAGAPVVLFFPGSTLGNLEPADAAALLARLRALPGVAALILGLDLVKPADVLVPAYDDAAGVTAAFNLNLLHRLNREANAAFDVATFRHEARWNADAARIEMHLVSDIAQQVRLHDHRIAFAAGESIHTENSHKFTREGCAGLAAQAGWGIADWITDAQGRFAVTVLT